VNLKQNRAGLCGAGLDLLQSDAALQHEMKYIHPAYGRKCFVAPQQSLEAGF
jgi:hypothetical protein